MKAKMKKIAIIALTGVMAVCMAGCDEGSKGSGGSSRYDYYDKHGNGYNDEDVNWGGGKNDKGQVGWDQAVEDWDRAH